MTSTASDRPARDAVLGCGVLGLVLALGVPPFLRMGLWPDATLYDVAARTVLRGGVHYRDVFDTNFPGMVWAHVAVRTLFGWRFEALRAADLAVVGAGVACLGRLVVLMGGTGATVAWLSVALSGLYLSTSEIYHCQRDVWMLVPALVAVLLRASAVKRLKAVNGSTGLLVARSIVEGLCWGAAIWIKPVVVVPAAACWGVGWRLARPTAGAGVSRARWIDAASLASGLAVAAALGVAWLWRSGAWPYFLDVMLNWTPEYAAPGYGARVRRHLIREALNAGRPWTFVHFAAVPVAIAALWRSRFNRRDADDAAALTAACYLGWVIQAWFLQPRVHPYTMLPTTLLAWPMVAGPWRPRGWRSSILALVAVVPLLFQPLASPARLGVWLRCLVDEGAALRDRLSLSPQMMEGSANWTDLDRVAAFLHSQHVADGELLCFNEVPHVLYLELDLKPPVRYMQFNLLVDGLPSYRAGVLGELNESHARFVVSDLVSIRVQPGERLPVPDPWQTRYPWNLPVVFRAGRYLVHAPALPATPFWR